METKVKMHTVESQRLQSLLGKVLTLLRGTQCQHTLEQMLTSTM